jgi:hypothetical protein
MPTHGRARQLTIAALENMKPFKRSGFAMSAVEGIALSTGRMPTEDAREYNNLANAGQVVYTVLSWETPIAYVTKDGAVRIPDAGYSQTTTQHQSMCRVYLNR